MSGKIVGLMTGRGTTRVVERPTYEPVIRRAQLRLCDVSLDAAHDDGLAHPYEGRTVGCGYGSCDEDQGSAETRSPSDDARKKKHTDIDKHVSPLARFTSIGSDALCEESLEIGVRMESLEDLCAQRVRLWGGDRHDQEYGRWQ